MATSRREETLQNWHAQYAAREPIIGCAVGTGISAKCSEAGGASFLVTYNAARFRMAGHPSLTGLLAYSDANAVVMELATDVLPVVSRIPVLAGMNGTDPFRRMDRLLQQLKEMEGVHGVHIMAIEWEEMVPRIAGEAGLLPRPQVA